ncbi:TPA: hypothetical protein U1151_002159 [Streptococcus suis]|nr:hypothetical protein [Streptococcus suis]HEM4902043.1 hypothetical protein [Streptococcus suis]HEM4953975.1 hypothetical protein [Streptococcus suis]
MIPKFRAWDKIRNRISEVERIYIDTKGVCLRDENGEYWRRFDDVILMQSTGLVDKNGKEIFEGDVVKLKYTVLSDYEFFKVTRFRGGSWRIDNRQRGSELWLRNEDCEVIGNIYENPELVEVTNEQATT